MTTIVFVETPEGVEIAFDSKVSTGYSHDELEQNKVFEAGGIVYGVAGAVSAANIMETMDIKPPSTEDPRETDLWVTSKFMPRLRKEMKQAFPWGQYEFPGHALIVVNRRVYKVGADYSRVRNTSGKYAIGSGSSYAKAALDAGASAPEAVRIAANNDVYTGHDIKTGFVK